MANKLLGQHFLANTAKLNKIISALNVTKGDFIIEVGPGHGRLTDAILAASGSADFKLVIIEKDLHLADKLISKYESDSRVTIVAGDILRELTSLVPRSNYKLVGNIPYYLTGRLLRLVGELPNLPTATIFMVQKEVGERIIATPPHFNRLAASLARWAEAKIIASLSPEDFKPAPKVSSVVVFLAKRSNSSIYPLTSYDKIIACLFAQPRKTILNNLTSSCDLDRATVLSVLNELNLSATARPSETDRDLIFKLSTELF